MATCRLSMVELHVNDLELECVAQAKRLVIAPHSDRPQVDFESLRERRVLEHEELGESRLGGSDSVKTNAVQA